MSEESEDYRRQLLRHLEQKYLTSKPAEVLEAEKLVAKYREDQLQAREAISRLREPLPAPDLCPRCWFMDGVHSSFHSVPADNPDRFDRMKCGRCGDHEDREIAR